MTKISKKGESKIMNLIVYILRSKSAPVSTNEMAQTLGRSWEYTHKILHKMSRKKMIKKISSNKYLFWRI